MTEKPKPPLTHCANGGYFFAEQIRSSLRDLSTARANEHLGSYSADSMLSHTNDPVTYDCYSYVLPMGLYDDHLLWEQKILVLQ